MEHTVSGIGTYTIHRILFDVNGTLSNKGIILPEVKSKISQLPQKDIEAVIISSDQRGTVSKIAHELGITYYIASTSDQKAIIASRFEKSTTAAMGNGRVDIGLFQNVVLRIGLLQDEGMHTGILPYTDVLFYTITDALDFFLDHNIFEATMKK